jgi:hypothetical protein
MRPSFLEAAELARVAAALQMTARPEKWRRQTIQATERLRPSVLISAPEAAGLRAAWALAQVSRFAPLAGLGWSPSGRHWARPLGPGARLRFEVRELETGMGGGLPGLLMQAMSRPPTTPALILFLSAGWGAGTLARAGRDHRVRGRAAHWRRCYLLADATCLALHPKTRLPTKACSLDRQVGRGALPAATSSARIGPKQSAPAP